MNPSKTGIRLVLAYNGFVVAGNPLLFSDWASLTFLQSPQLSQVSVYVGNHDMTSINQDLAVLAWSSAKVNTFYSRANLSSFYDSLTQPEQGIVKDLMSTREN